MVQPGDKNVHFGRYINKLPPRHIPILYPINNIIRFIFDNQECPSPTQFYPSQALPKFKAAREEAMKIESITGA